MLRSLGNAQPWRFFVAFFMASLVEIWATIDKTKQVIKQTLCLK